MSRQNTPSAPIDRFTGLSASRFGVYVHFPYCLSKCPYCDFASTAAREVPEEAWAAAVLAELERRVDAHGLGGREVESVYFGGGTPSLWHPRWVERVLEGVGRALRLAGRCEVTLEANPGASDAARFAGYRAAGVNRLSIGVQSLQAVTLAALGRSHDAAAAVAAFGSARRAGFDNVSLDVIYGVQGQTVEQARADAEALAALGPEHVSAYALTLDRESLAEEVPLARQLARGEVRLPDDEAVVAMQRAAAEAFARAGLARYEVSNYARDGFHSRHNSLYWTGGEYLGLGGGATGFLRTADGAFRYTNHRSAERYLATAEGLPEVQREALGAVELFEERLAMGLRLASGVDVEAVCAAWGQDVAQRAGAIAALVEAGLAVRDGARLRLTPRGLDLHSAVAARLM